MRSRELVNEIDTNRQGLVLLAIRCYHILSLLDPFRREQTRFVGVLEAALRLVDSF